MVHSLRARVTLASAFLGTLVALLFAFATWYTLEAMENAFLDRILQDELAFFIEDYRQDPGAGPPDLASLKGYVVPVEEVETLPGPVRDLGEGTHELLLGEQEHHAAVAERDGLRFVLLYDEYGLDAIEVVLIRFLAASSLIIVLLSAGLGWMAAGRITAPVRSLAGWVAARGENREAAIPEGVLKGDDEMRSLAFAFEEAFRRVEGFLLREQELTADVSHQLRSPVAVIMSSLELLLAEPDLRPPQRRKLLQVAEAGRFLAQQIEAVLLLAREKPEEPVAPLSVESVVSQAVRQQRAVLAAGEGPIELEVTEDVSLAVPAAALELVVENLVRNAVSHGAGKVWIEVGAGELVVRNEGPEIPEEVLKRVFERGFSVTGNGSGLGLAIARRICERYGWRLTLASEGRRTTARLAFSGPPGWLPPGEGPKENAGAASAAGPGARSGGLSAAGSS